ncbi:Uncharacterized protein PAT23_0949 [Pseudomonas aeruginosa]|nr:Uncharacterized protein PAT23_0949 [Pseudomonas aeruginosa]QEO39015.1 Uncharacterized protein PAT169_5024 [Pseudomonas aeruginosa]
MGCSIAVESGRRLYSAKCDSCRASRRPQRPILPASPIVPAPVDSAGARPGADALPCGFLCDTRSVSPASSCMVSLMGFPQGNRILG